MNLIAPLEFDEQEIGKFLRDHVCAICRRHLISRHAPNRMYNVHCVTHGVIMSHNAIHRAQAEQAEINERMGLLELRQAKQTERRSAEEILADLGF